MVDWSKLSNYYLMSDIGGGLNLMFVIYYHFENSNEKLRVLKKKRFLFTQRRGSIYTVVVRGVALESLTEQWTLPHEMTEFQGF